MTAAAVIVAGGEGSRMQSRLNKVFLEINGEPILGRSLALFESSPQVTDVGVVARRSDIGRCQAVATGFAKVRAIVPGGAARHDSEFAGVRALAARIDAGDIDLVLVHDAVRPFASAALVRRLIEGTTDVIGCIPGLPVDPHTVEVADGLVSGDPKNLWAVQTPQAFEATWLLEAHNKAARQRFAGTDTASVVEWAGGSVRVIEGEIDNIKITTPADLELAEFYMEQEKTKA